MWTSLLLPSTGGGAAPLDAAARGVHRVYQMPGGGEAGAHHASGHVATARPLTGEVAGQMAPLSTLILLGALLTVAQCCVVLAMTSVFVLINNACRRRDRGAGNGIGQTCASLGRAVGPAVCGIVFAWSQRAQLPWPLDYHVVFYMLAVLTVLVISLSRRLPAKINNKLYGD